MLALTDDGGRCSTCGRYDCHHLAPAPSVRVAKPEPAPVYDPLRACPACGSTVTTAAGVSYPDHRPRRWCLRCGWVYLAPW